jgi:tetratricopeptide (TPR) repeat protein
MCQRIHGNQDHPDVARNLNSVAGCLQALGRSGEALPLYRQALEMCQRLYGNQDHPDVAATLNNLAGCLQALGRSGEALSLYRQALEMCRRLHGNQDHPDVATSLNNLASCLKALGRPGEALPLFRQMLEMYQRIYGNQDHPEAAASLDNVAFCLFALGRTSEALPVSQQAVAMGERLDDPDAYRYLGGLGRIYLQLARPADAEAALANAFDREEQSRLRFGGTAEDRMAAFSVTNAFVITQDMVRAQLILRKPTEALTWAERGRARGLLEVLQRGEMLKGQSLAQVVAAAAKARHDASAADQASGLGTQLAAEETDIRAAWAQRELLRGRADLSETERVDQIDALSEKIRQTQNRLSDIQRQLDELAAQFVNANLKPLSAQDIQAVLKPQERLLEYFVGNQDSVLLIVSSDGQAAYTLQWTDGTPVTEKSLDRGVALYLWDMLRDQGEVRGLKLVPDHASTQPADASHGYELFKALFPADLWPELQKASTLYVVADGALCTLPLESLPVADPAGLPAERRHYWLDDGPPVAYEPSGTVLANRRQARDLQKARWASAGPPKTELVALGDPVFSRGAEIVPNGSGRGEVTDVASNLARSGYAERYHSLHSLPGTRQEIAGLFEDVAGQAWNPGADGCNTSTVASGQAKGRRVVTLVGESATARRLYDVAPGARYLHLATHGLVEAGDAAIYSSLALTQPANASADDYGFLTLADLLARWSGRLDDTELVVLSACDTDRGQSATGEGVLGLPWGFMYAGSPAVIASLWEVDDASTAELMTNFYKSIEMASADGKETQKLTAFVAARRALRAKYPQPFYWAPFIYTGEP